jgi:hypothetical protein
MIFTIDDARKFISNIYGWMTVNTDFTFISNSVNDCSSDEYVNLRYQLENLKTRTRVILNSLSDSIEESDLCIQQLKLTIERERTIRKQAIREKRRMKRK